MRSQSFLLTMLELYGSCVIGLGRWRGCAGSFGAVLVAIVNIRRPGASLHLARCVRWYRSWYRWRCVVAGTCSVAVASASGTAHGVVRVAYGNG